jgi:hypothetical protein
MMDMSQVAGLIAIPTGTPSRFHSLNCEQYMEKSTADESCNWPFYSIADQQTDSQLTAHSTHSTNTCTNLELTLLSRSVDNLNRSVGPQTRLLGLTIESLVDGEPFLETQVVRLSVAREREITNK